MGYSHSPSEDRFLVAMRSLPSQSLCAGVNESTPAPKNRPRTVEVGDTASDGDGNDAG